MHVATIRDNTIVQAMKFVTNGTMKCEMKHKFHE